MDTQVPFPIEEIGSFAAYHAVPETRQHALPLLFLHGAWGGKYQFEQWLRFAETRGWEGYALDLRTPHGSPDAGTASPTIEQYARDVEAAIDLIGPCYLIGHSQGGLIAQVIAARDAHVKKAVFAASSPAAGTAVINAFAIRLLRYLPGLIRHTPFMLTEHDAARYLFNDLMPEQVRSLGPDSSAAALEIIFGMIKPGEMPCPTLVIAGDSDRALPLSSERKIARKYGSDLIEISGMGHMLMLLPGWEAPIEKILDWLAA